MPSDYGRAGRCGVDLLGAGGGRKGATRGSGSGKLEGTERDRQTEGAKAI